MANIHWVWLWLCFNFKMWLHTVAHLHSDLAISNIHQTISLSHFFCKSLADVWLQPYFRYDRKNSTICPRNIEISDPFKVLLIKMLMTVLNFNTIQRYISMKCQITQIFTHRDAYAYAIVCKWSNVFFRSIWFIQKKRAKYV